MREAYAVRVIVEKVDLDNEPRGISVTFANEWDAITVADYLRHRGASMDLAEVLGESDHA